MAKYRTQTKVLLYDVILQHVRLDQKGSCVV